MKVSRRFGSSSTRESSTARRGSPAPTSQASTCCTSSPVETFKQTGLSRQPTYATAIRALGADLPWSLRAGVEIGHIFQLGRKYAEALELKVLDENGKLVTVTMGSYGIGVSRAVAAIAELNHDDIGLCWPREVAPADVHLVATGKDDAVFAVAEALSLELEAAGLARHLRRPPEGLAGCEVQGRRTARDADHRRHRQEPRRWRDRGT